MQTRPNHGVPPASNPGTPLDVLRHCDLPGGALTPVAGVLLAVEWCVVCSARCAVRGEWCVV
eukprot:1154061-Pelagomonas_calceolata.AAC.5